MDNTVVIKGLPVGAVRWDGSTLQIGALSGPWYRVAPAAHRDAKRRMGETGVGVLQAAIFLAQTSWLRGGIHPNGLRGLLHVARINGFHGVRASWVRDTEGHCVYHDIADALAAEFGL